nr:hypothetical protein [Providencia rettgeri]
MTEAEIAACVEAWMKWLHWEVYPEVHLKHHGKRPDFVATKGPLVQVIECKKAIGLPVLEQAMAWFYPYRSDKVGLPHLIYVACKKSSGRRDFPLLLMRQWGIGLLEVEKSPSRKLHYDGITEKVSEAHYSLRVQLEPRMVPGSRHQGKILRAQLHDDMRIAVAGTTGTGQFMTDWKRTMIRIETLMEDGKQRHVAEIVDWLNVNGGYHWASRSSAVSGINTSLMRQGYECEAYGFEGRGHRWKFVEGVTQKVLKTSSPEWLVINSLHTN